MRIKKTVSMMLLSAMAASIMSGCTNGKTGQATETKTEDGKEKVTVALWGNQMLENYSPYLCETFPDVEFEFVLATNSLDFYRYCQKHDDMPDILSVRRFALKDAVLLKDYLYDLGDTELASTYYGTYLDNYTYDDGTVNWLPACAEVDSLIINKTMFEEYEILNEYGFIVDSAENGREAVDKIASSKPGVYDLVLMDIQMPVMNGYEATKSIRALEDSELSAVPIVAMTANAFDEDRKATEECGMNGFISKPINMEEVIGALHSVLSNK